MLGLIADVLFADRNRPVVRACVLVLVAALAAGAVLLAADGVVPPELILSTLVRRTPG